MILSGEELGVLNLIKEINIKMAHMNRGAIAVFIDNKKVLAGISSEILEESQCTIETSIAVKEIK